LVRVTVEPGGPGGGSKRIARVRSRAPVIAVTVVALGAAALAGAAVLGLVTSRTTVRATPPVHTPIAQARDAGPVGVAAAYRYPLACLSVTIAKADPDFAAARLDRASPCWRYGVYTTTILHRVAGVWRVALETSGASCSISSIPAVVRAQLGLCAGGPAPPAAIANQRRGGQGRGVRAVRNDWDLPRALNADGSES
jgi:hypothetical protein